MTTKEFQDLLSELKSDDKHKPVFDTEKRFYYHVTGRKWSEEVKNLVPLRYSMGRGKTEPIFGRICVCPSIALCFTAFHLDYDK